MAEYTNLYEPTAVAIQVYNPVTLAWERGQQPVLDVGGDVIIAGTVTVTGTLTGVTTVTTVSTLTNLVQMNGAAISMNTGVRDAGTQRVTIATNDSVPVTGTFWQATQPVSGTVTANAGTGTFQVGDAGAIINLDASGDAQVDVLTIAAGDNNIGNVDVVTLPNVTLAAGTNTNEVVGDVAHDAAAAGNPLLTCGVAQDMDDTAPPNQVSAEGDATRLATDRDGAVFVRPFGPRIWSYHENSSSALTDASVHAAPAAGLSLYVTDIVVSTGAATALNVFFEEGASTVLGPYYLEAVVGRGLALHFGTPKKITAATALTITTSAAIAHGIDVTGYTAAG